MNEMIQLNGREIIDRFLTFRNDWSRSTKLVSGKSIIAMMKWLGHRPLNIENFHAWAAWLGKNKRANTAERELKHCIWFCQWLKSAGWIKEDPSVGVKRPKVYQLPPKEGYTPEEYVRLRDNAGPLIRTFIIIAFHTGMSQVDVCTLRWEDVKLDQMMIIRQRKKMAKRNGATQYIPIVNDTDLHTELLRLREVTYHGDDTHFVEPMLEATYNNLGGKAGPDSWDRGIIKRLNVVCKRAGVRSKGTHGFRRGLLTAVASQPEVNLLHAANLSGHSNLQMLKRYVKPQPERIRASLAGVLAEHFAKTTLPVLPPMDHAEGNIVLFPNGSVPAADLLADCEEEPEADTDSADCQGRGHVHRQGAPPVQDAELGQDHGG